ncbi:uncharacterized protein, partial [Centruroides vittatus]|uniref:uncharacterized protein n=1 Tax=Centruroides vittatus TaxID=120091 RepID=UPI0035101BFA
MMFKMSRKISLIEDFIFPKLEDESFGHALEWENRNEGTFVMFWPHKSRRKWKETDFVVFAEWDRKKGNYKPKKQGYWTNAKGRLRSAFCRLSNKIEFLGKVSKSMPYRRYRLKNIDDLISLSDNRSQLPTTMVSGYESFLPTEENFNLSCINNPPALNGMSNEFGNLNNNEN